MSRPKKPKLPLLTPFKAWAVYSAEGYASSTHCTEELAIRRHCNDFDISWREALERGDRLFRVAITPIQKA